MKRKYILFFMQFLTSVCMVSVGFASWTIVSGDSLTAYGNVVAEDVEDPSLYVSFDKEREDGGVKGFKYCSTGFLDDKYNVINYGTCSAYMKINLANCKARFPENKSLKIQIELKYGSNYNYLDNYHIFSSDNSDITYKVVLNNGLEIKNVEKTQNNSCKLTFVLTNYLTTTPQIVDGEEVLDDLVVDISFALKNFNFKEDYKKLDVINFEYSIGIEGVD